MDQDSSRTSGSELEFGNPWSVLLFAFWKEAKGQRNQRTKIAEIVRTGPTQPAYIEGHSHTGLLRAAFAFLSCYSWSLY